jgi:hypothetical protein
MINRKALAAGAFLVSAGAVALVGSANPAVGDAIVAALRLWPLAIIALGAGLLLRRTRLGVVGIVVTATVPGLLLGGIVVAAPEVPTTICVDAADLPAVTHEGTFNGDATVDLSIACGDLTVTTTPGTGWDASVLDFAANSADVVATPDRLSIRTSTDEDAFRWGPGGDAWRVALPTGTTLDLSADVNAGEGTLDLAGARLGVLEVEVNAGSARVDLSTATLDRLVVSASAGSASVRLPVDDITGTLDAAAGSVEICTPADLGLRITGDAVLGSIDTEGMVRVGDAWQTPGYPSATAHADLFVSASAGSVAVNPAGGCK